MTPGNFLLLSAALHLIGSVLTRFEGVGLFLLFPALLYTGFYFGLRHNLRWVAWTTLICMLGGIAGTVWELLKVSIVPDWVLWGIVFADFVAATLLVRLLWNHPHR